MKKIIALTLDVQAFPLHSTHDTLHYTDERNEESLLFPLFESIVLHNLDSKRKCPRDFLTLGSFLFLLYTQTAFFSPHEKIRSFSRTFVEPLFFCRIPVSFCCTNDKKPPFKRTMAVNTLIEMRTRNLDCITMHQKLSIFL